MALNPNPIGTAIANYLQTQAPAAGHEVTPTELEIVWQGIMSLIYSDIKATMDVLPAAHSGVSFNSPLGQSVTIPVTSAQGNASAGTTSAPQPIAGQGSVQ